MKDHQGIEVPERRCDTCTHRVCWDSHVWMKVYRHGDQRLRYRIYFNKGKFLLVFPSNDGLEEI